MGRYFFINVCLFVAGGVVLFRLRKKYPGIRRWEVWLVIFLYAILVLLFTDGMVNVFKTFIEEAVL